MPYALVTVHNKLEQLAEMMFSLEHDHAYTTIATGGTFKYLTRYGLEKVVLVADYFRVPGNVSHLFKTTLADLYDTITQQRSFGPANEPIRVVVVDFKPAGPPEQFLGRPDVGGPTLAKVAACAVLYEQRHLWVLTGENLSRRDYESFRARVLETNALEEYDGQCRYAREALGAIAKYEAGVHQLNT